MFSKIKLYFKQKRCDHCFIWATHTKENPYRVIQECSCKKCGGTNIPEYIQYMMNDEANKILATKSYLDEWKNSNINNRYYWK